MNIFDWNLVLENLLKIGAGLAVFTILWLSNFSLSLFYNIKRLKEKFNWQKMIDGFEKLIAVIIGLGLLCLGITTIIPVIGFMGVEIDKFANEIITISMIGLIILKRAYYYGRQAYNTFENIMGK